MNHREMIYFKRMADTFCGIYVGLTASWNRAWDFFVSSGDRWTSLFILNNDLLVSSGSFELMHNALHSQRDVMAVVPFSDTQGLGKRNKESPQVGMECFSMQSIDRFAISLTSSHN